MTTPCPASFQPVADFILGTPDIPAPVLDRAATLLVDTLGVAAGAASMDAGRIARDHATRFMRAGTPRDSAHMLFDGRRVSIPGAGFALASQIDNLDAHDGHNLTKGHIGCAVVPALFAFAEAAPNMSTRDALIHMVIAYEIAARAGVVLHATASDYHTSGAWNALAVAALGCRMRGATPEQLRHALGIAEYHGPRSQMMREIATPTMLHDGSGMGAMVGSMATALALDGFTGAPAITVEDGHAEWSDLAQRWTLPDNYIKPWPICRWAHAAIGAAQDLRDSHNIRPEMIASIEVATFAEAAALYPGMPETTSQAQYSLPFAVATMLAHGRIGPAEITGAFLHDPVTSDHVARTRVSTAPRFDALFPAQRFSEVTVTLKDGRRLTSGDVPARGGVEAPISIHTIQAKFRVMTEALPQARADAIWGFRDGLADPATRFADLFDAVRAPISPT